MRSNLKPMTSFNSVLLKTLAVAAFLWISSCTYSQTFIPEFNGKQSAVVDSINTRYSFEDIETQEKKTSGTGGNHTVLTIKFINGKNIPTDNDEITALAKQLALQVKSTLKNPKEVESYTVIFDTKTVAGSITTNKFVGHEFKPGEI